MGEDTGGTDDVSLRNFEHLDDIGNVAAYIRALETFDAQAELQELKSLAVERTGVRTGAAILDIGCGFGLETLRLARLAGPWGRVEGIDLSAGFIAEARRRAEAAGLAIGFREGNAEALPYDDATFDIVRAERLLIYLDAPLKALAEMRRVVRPGGAIALIEPDFETNTINIPDRPLVRRVLQHECDAGVRQGWLVRDLKTMLEELGFEDIAIATRVVLFDPDLASGYFTRLGGNAHRAGVIDADEEAAWARAITERHAAGRLFCTIGYYLFTARLRSGR